MEPSDRPDVEHEGIEPGPEDTGLWPAITDPALVPAEPMDERLEELATPAPGGAGRIAADVAEPPAPSPGEFGPRLLAALSHMSQMVEERMSALETLFEREIRAEATRERIVDRLHSELQEYKHDLLLKVQRPIFIDLIQLHDDLGKLIEAQPTEELERADVLRNTLESVRTAIEDILYRQGVEPFRTEGPDFDARRQRAVSTVATEDQEKVKTIAARLRPGFQAGEKLIRPEIVSVFVLMK